MSQDSNTVMDGARIATRRLETEVAAKAVRRRFSAEYKLRILEEAETCSGGEIGALLRREGLYSSHLTTWRRQREAEELKRLRKENERLQVRLQQAEAIIEAQKKLAHLSECVNKSVSLLLTHSVPFNVNSVAPKVFNIC